MNKYKEAKAWIDKINKNPQWNKCDIEEPALSQLTELVERATPKLPKGYSPLSKAVYYRCPVCSSPVGTQSKYCRQCGQSIKWEKIDWGGAKTGEDLRKVIVTPCKVKEVEK